MQGAKKAVVAVLLIAVVVAAGVWIARSRSSTGKGRSRAMGRLIERIDENTLETITLSVQQWKDLGHKDGKFKNPNTGTYSMLSVMKCPHCGAKIPMPIRRSSRMVKAVDKNTGKEVMRLEQVEQVEYHCPKCGELIK